MCRLTPAGDKTLSTTPSTTTNANSKSISSFVLPQLWPLPLWLVVAAIPLIPSSFFLNRGYTRWFHWCSFAFLLTQNKVLCQFIAVQGLLINVGWYCTLLTDYIVNGRLLHILYRNMPDALGQYILEGPNVTGYNVALLPLAPTSICAQLLALSLDFALHPLLCYSFWRRCDFLCGKKRWHDVCSWKVLGAALVLSRVWSLAHNWLHYQEIGFYYFGPQVYKVAPLSEHLWMAAYVGEAITTVILVTGKLWIGWKGRSR